MEINKLIEELDKIRTYKGSKIGASLKKPLFLLLLISLIEGGKVKRNKFYFPDIERELDLLIRTFGGRVGKGKPEQPFHHLNSSIIWDIHVPYGTRFSNKETLPISVLRDPETYGYINNEIFKLLSSDNIARAEAAQFILGKYWPETVQKDIADLLNLPVKAISKQKRDRNFVDKVLANYRHKCAICGFSSLFNQVPFGLDAAHIQWHAYGGPDNLGNGLALCKLHHWALDRGVVTIEPDKFEIILSSKFVAQEEISISFLENIKGSKLQQFRDVPPDKRFMAWHNENVFVL
ncbi:phosphorothioated DNA-binding restriction endonuclease [Halalkalibacter urbisdiaboli]|uniref:phosphorothioated DNA-binding restriction endonuclease n=1 Tax=Halalkalibacter urbisdiaboli TaxID=1960589 RepID=UPI000B443497|nr:HNH endonuclease [Halalkalibacter urbisdiaboli]